MGIGPYELTAVELSTVLAADRDGVSYLLFRTRDSQLVLHALDAAVTTIGRAPQSDVVLDWDAEVSRAHARLELVANRWTVVDEGLSRNGTFVGLQRVNGRRPLDSGDLVRVGSTVLVLRTPAVFPDETIAAVDAAEAVHVTAAERRVLVALCRPFAVEGGGPAAPASNADIAADLVLSVAGVKTHLRALFGKLGVDDLPQNAKRAELARRAIATGLVRPADLAAQE